MARQMIVMRAATLAILAMAGAAVADGGRGAPLLTDDFSVKESFPERWRVSESARFNHGTGVLRVRGSGSIAAATLIPSLPENFWVEADLSYDTDVSKDYWAGFQIDGHLFLTLNGKSWLHPTGDAATSEQAGKVCTAADYKVGKPLHIAVSRQASAGSFKYSFFLNGAPAGHFFAKAPAVPKPFELRVYNCDVSVRHFGLYVLKSDDSSPNLVYNASCERTYSYDLPMLVNVYCRFPFGEIPLEEYERSYLGTFRTDTAERHSGARSIRVDINHAMHSPEIWPWGTATMKGQPGVFSVWMKASVDALPIKMEYGGVWRHHRVGRAWTRYEVVNPSLGAPGPYSPVRVIVENPDRTINATLWLDDFQAELIDLKPGEKVSPAKTYATPFRLSDLDRDMFAARPDKPERLVIDVPELPAGVRPTANLDAWSRHAALAEKFFNRFRQPTHATKMFIACDREALYVGVRAFGEPLANVAKPRAARDTLAIYNNDGLELFFSPNRERQWHHLMANANGSMTDLFGEDIKWNGRWSMTAKANPTAGAVDYCVRIPATDFARADMKDAWYASFCRDDATKGEALSMFNNLKGNYRQIELWPEMRFPRDVVAAWRRLAPAEKGTDERKTEVVGRLNFYMTEPEAAFRLVAPDGAFETVSLPLGDMPVGTNRVTLTARDGTTHPAEVVKLPYHRYATQINRFARCIERHGKKIFPIAKMSHFCWPAPYAVGAAELYGRIGGVNAILETADSFDSPQAKSLATRELFAAALARMPNVYRIHEFNFILPGPEAGAEAREKAWRKIRFMQEHFEDRDEDVLLTGVTDEPELTMTSETCLELLKALRPRYPYRPMMMNNTHMGIPNNFAKLESDILSLDDYLTGSFGRTVAESLVNVDICSKTAKRLHRPSFACLVSGNTPYNYREPSQAEQVAQCYGAFVGGIHGFFLWGDVPYSRGDWEGNKQVCREFAALTPYVLTEETDPDFGMLGGGPAFRARCCRFGATDTLVAVNIDEKPAGRITFTLPADRRGVTKVSVLFENREIPVRNGRFTDDFADLTRHVYRWLN